MIAVRFLTVSMCIMFRFVDKPFGSYSYTTPLRAIPHYISGDGFECIWIYVFHRFFFRAFQSCPQTGGRMPILSAQFPYERPELACNLRVQRPRWIKETCGFATVTGTWAKCAFWVSTPNRRLLRVTAYVTHVYCALPRYRHPNASSKSPSSVGCLQQGFNDILW